MEAMIIYWSGGGNTAKVAQVIKEELDEAGVNAGLTKVEDAWEIDLYAYGLICFGFPSYHWNPPKPADDFLKSRFKAYRKQGLVKIGAPKIPGKNALIFCTYSGPHTGIREAVPAGLYAGQFFEHFGFDVLDELYVVGEFHGSEEFSTKGRLGDIRGRPNEEDLYEVKEKITKIVKDLNVYAKAE